MSSATLSGDGPRFNAALQLSSADLEVHSFADIELHYITGLEDPVCQICTKGHQEMRMPLICISNIFKINKNEFFCFFNY